MKIVSAVLATTHVDRHNEVLHLSALEGMVTQLNASYLPLWTEHDPRIPPYGRVKSAEIQQTPDGEFSVVGVIEVFEAGDTIPVGGTRRTVVRFCESESIVLVDDRSFRSPEDQAIIEQLRTVFAAERVTEAKKSVEAIAVLTIALKAVALGGLGKIGSDMWSAAKPKLKQLFARKRNASSQILNLAATIEDRGEPRLVEVILSNPEDPDIDSLQPSHLEQAIALAKIEVERAPFLVRFVFSYSAATGLLLQFAVASNGVPVMFASMLPPSPELKGLSGGGPASE